MKLFKLLFITLFAVTLGTRALANTDDQLDVRANNLSWEFALNTGQTAALLDMYAKDAVILPPSSEILTNHAAIKTYWDNLRRVGVGEYAIYTVDIHIDRDIAYQTALWEATRIDKDGNVFHFDGNMTNILERQQDGRWVIRLQSWN